MRGSIVKKGARYYVVVDAFEDGKRKRKWHAAGATKREAEDMLHEVVGRVRRGVHVAPTKVRLGEYLTGHWVPAARATLKPSTVELYETMIASYVEPYIGGLRLQEVTAGHLNKLYADLAASGGRGGRALGAKTVRNVHGVLHRALRDAVRWDLAVRNVAETADPPRISAPEVKPWTADQLRGFLEATADDRTHPLWLTIASTGLRRGEALALRWSDVDLDAGRAQISRTLAWVDKKPTFTEPKTRGSRRRVPLSSDLVAALREHRRRQLEERLAAGEAWQDHDLVFAQEDGSPLPPKRITKTFTRHAAAAGLPHLTVHGLRHTWATLALTSGVPLKVVSDMLGHASIAVTADIYSHVTETMAEDAASRVAALFR